MARLASIVIPGIPHHVTQRGNRREQVFFGPADYQAFLDAGGHSESGCFKVCGIAGQAGAEKILELLRDHETKK